MEVELLEGGLGGGRELGDGPSLGGSAEARISQEVRSVPKTVGPKTGRPWRKMFVTVGRTLAWGEVEAKSTKARMRSACSSGQPEP